MQLRSSPRLARAIVAFAVALLLIESSLAASASGRQPTGLSDQTVVQVPDGSIVVLAASPSPVPPPPPTPPPPGPRTPGRPIGPGPVAAAATTTTVLTLNPPSDPAGGACALPFSSGYSSPDGGFNQATPLIEHRSLPLASFAGHIASIHFSFDTLDERFNKFEGWYVDNLLVTDTARGTLFSDDVESGTGGWTTSGSHGTAPGWHLTTRRGSLGGAASGHAWWYGNDANGTYQPTGSTADCGDVRNSGDLVSAPFVVGQNSSLSFDTLWQIESVNPSSFDLMRVQIDDLGPAYALGPYPGSEFSRDPVNLATGNFMAHADDLTLPGRVLGLAFARWYNAADPTKGPLGPAWTHSFNWTISDDGGTVTVRRGDGRQDTFTRNPDGSYADPPNVFDTLTKNPDGSFTLTLTNQVLYEFSSAGKLTRIHEPAGNQITLAYVGANLTTITDTVGRQVTLTYDASNRLSQLQDPLGRRVTYAYDASGRLATVTDKIGNATGQNPALHQWKYAYDGTSPHITTITDPDSRVRVTNTYDSLGRVFQQRDALNKLTQLSYSAGQTVLTDPRLHATTYTFDARMRVLTQADVVGANTYTLSYVYDAAGNRTSVTDRNGKTTDFTYDAHANVKTKTDPQIDPQTPRYVTRFDYDTKNNLTSVTDARNFVTTLTYEPTTNVLLSVSRQIDAVANAITKYEYTDAANPGLPTKIIAPRGNTGPTPNYLYATSITYDAQANLTQRIDPDGARTTFAYDGVGRLTSFVDPDGYATGAVAAEHTWRVSYDENDRETSRTDPLGNVLRFGYDGAGNRTSLTDRRGNITAYTYDLNTRLATVQQKPDPVGQPTLVYTTQVTTRDDNGNATRITQANGVATDYGFDALDRLTAVSTHPDATTTLTTSYVLDGNGQPLSRTTADNVTVTYSYDALSRPTSVAATGLATIGYTYDAASNRTQMTDETGTTTYLYDGLGRVTQVAAPNGTLTYAYDRDGNRTTLGYPGSQNVTYSYSPGGRLGTVTDWASRVSSYSYQPSGLVSALQYPDGMRAAYTYDRAQRLTQLVNAVGATTLTSHAYTLDQEGNRTALDEFVSSIASPTPTWSATQPVNDQVSGLGVGGPAVALGADLASYAAWDDGRRGDYDIFFSRRDAASAIWSANQRVNTDTGTAWQLGPPAIGVDGSNNAYVLWEDRRNSSGDKPDIYFGKRPAATGTWSADRQVNDDRGGSAEHRQPRIAVRADGSAVAVWVDDRSKQHNIFSARLAAGASAWGTNMRVTNNTTAIKSLADVVVAPDGAAHAVWQDQRNGNADVYYAKLPAGSSTWSANVKVSDDPGTATQAAPRIGVDGAGNLLVIWWDNRTSPAQIRMSRLLAGSSTWEPSRVVSDPAARPQGVDWPVLAVRADGSAFAGWLDSRGAGFNQAPVYGSDYDPATVTWTVSQLLTTNRSHGGPALAADSTQVALVWADGESSFPPNILYRRRTSGSGVDHFSYAYDGLNRLTSVSGPTPEAFTLDAATNIASRTGPVATNSFDTSNRQTSDGARSFVWSPADRLVQRGADTFAYDPLGRLTSATVAGSTRAYGYNGDGLLASAGGTINLWDVGMAPEALLQAGTDKVVHGLGPLYGVRADASTYTFARDGLGSVRAEVGDSGVVSKSFRYAAYGAIVQSMGGSPTLLGFAGELTDPSGLIYLRARWYDPAVGRFISSDPYLGGVAIPSSLNPFGYGHGRPTLFTDPLGLDSEDSDLQDAVCTGVIPLPGKCFAPGKLANDYEVTVLATIRPVGGLPLQIFFATTTKSKSTAGGGGGGGGGPGGGDGRLIYYLYQKLSAAGEHLKYGVTTNPLTRYTRAQLAGGRLKLIAQGTAKDIFALERAAHEWLPIGPEEGQDYYKQVQARKGFRLPPY